MNDTKQLPDGLPPLPEGTYYAGTLADFKGYVEGWVSAGPHNEWDHGMWGGMKNFPNQVTASWHVAIPIQDAPKQHDDGGPAFQFRDTPVSLRDWFAGMALQSLISEDPKKTHALDNPGGRTWDDWVSMNAYGIADAMLAARKEAP